MKKFAFMICSLAACSVFAEAQISMSCVKQRWPWSPKVDIDLWLDGTNAADVTLNATWEGQSAPVTLNGPALSGSTNLRKGINKLTWDPESAGYGNQALKGFTVTPVFETSDARRYLRIDLAQRTWAYFADDPEGNGWTNILNKTRYMVFRRIPAGVYRIGFTDEQIDYLWSIGGSANAMTKAEAKTAYSARTISITHDYYVAIFKLTGGQHTGINYWNTYQTKSEGLVCQKNGKNYYWSSRYCGDLDIRNGEIYTGFYSVFRGNNSDVNTDCLWPRDGHAVPTPDPNVVSNGAAQSAGCLIGRFRRLMSTETDTPLPSDMIIDLPTEAQWEVAARAGRSTISPLGHDIDAAFDDFKNDQIAMYVYQGDTKTVGTMQPNGWGIYDALGMSYDFVLNTMNIADAADFLDGLTPRAANDLVDPVGLVTSPDIAVYVAAVGNGWSCRGGRISSMEPNRRMIKTSSSNSACSGGVRLVIDLAPVK